MRSSIDAIRLGVTLEVERPARLRGADHRQAVDLKEDRPLRFDELLPLDDRLLDLRVQGDAALGRRGVEPVRALADRPQLVGPEDRVFGRLAGAFPLGVEILLFVGLVIAVERVRRLDKLGVEVAEQLLRRVAAPWDQLAAGLVNAPNALQVLSPRRAGARVQCRAPRCR